MDTSTGVLAVDDSRAFLEAVSALISATPGMIAVGEATCGEEAVRLADDLRPDLVLMDVRMPGIGGLAAARRIKAAHPSTVVALVSTTRPDELPAAADEADADALVWKCALRPAVLEEIWERHRPRPRSAAAAENRDAPSPTPTSSARGDVLGRGESRNWSP